MKAKRILLRYVCSKVDGKATASEITKSIHLLMSIQWGKRAWDEVSEDTIKKCFQKVGLYPDECITSDDDDDPFEGEDMQILEELCSTLDISERTSVREFLDAEEEISTCEEHIDSDTPTWREDIRAKIIEEVTNEDCEPPAKEPKDVTDDDNEDDEFDRSLNEPVIKSSFEALKVVEQLAEFAQFRGLEEVSNAIFNVNDILMDYRLRESRKQTCIDSFLI